MSSATSEDVAQMNLVKTSVDTQIAKGEDVLKHLEAYENLKLKDTDTVQKLTKESLKTATQ